MLSFEDLMTRLYISGSENVKGADVSKILQLFMDKVSESYRSPTKRCKERCLEEANQLLRQLPDESLRGLGENHLLLLLVRLLLSMQLHTASISTACRKVDQMLQRLADVNQQLVYDETQHCLQSIIQTDQILSHKDLQRVCMFLEDSAVGRRVWRRYHLSLLNKVSELLGVALQQEALRDGPLCYTAVKVCLQAFQLLSSEVAPLVWDKTSSSAVLQEILQVLVDLILGECCNRDTRFLAGTAVSMLINTAPEGVAGGAAAWSLMQVSPSEPWLLSVGALQAQCRAAGEEDGEAKLAVSRGLLTCCSPRILLSSPAGVSDSCLLLQGLFPSVCTMCEQRLGCHYFAFEVLTLWLRKVKECRAEIWKATAIPLLDENSCLQQKLIQIIWTNAESPVEGVSELVRSAFSLLLELYEMECEHFGDTRKPLFSTLLQRIIELPWETKAKYQRLCGLLPYLNTDMVLSECPRIPAQLLKCLSNNRLSPCGTELYKCLIRQHRQELRLQSPGSSEPELADSWAVRWRTFLLEALTSDLTLLQNNASSLVLPCTFQTFPSAVEPLLASLQPSVRSHLYAWACIMSSHRATTGSSPWGSSTLGTTCALGTTSALETLQLALGSADDKVRLAALNLLCCSPKTREAPTAEEMSIMKMFVAQNMNCESSPFRQHLQAALRRFLVRIRDGCLVLVKGLKASKKGEAASRNQTRDGLEQGIAFIEWLGQLPYCYLAPGHSYQRKKTALLLLSAVLETCTDTWSPDKKKGQPPANMGSLVRWARQQGKWDFICRSKQIVLITCLEDSTNEIRELSASLLLRFFQPHFPDDVAAALHRRSTQLLSSPRVQEAQMGALMTKVLFHKSKYPPGSDHLQAPGTIQHLLVELELHYATARADMMLAAKSKPIHGVLSALQRCLLEAPRSVSDLLDRSMAVKLLKILEDISLLLLAVLYGDPDACVSDMDAPPSFCDMGNAIRSLIVQASRDTDEDGDERVLLSEEHSLVLTCCWVSLKEIGILLGCLVERILSESKTGVCLLTKEDLTRASKVFENILLKCRHWGTVEGACVGFTKFCAALLSSGDAEIRDIPAHMLRQGLNVVQSLRSTSVTRRAAGLPMLILCVLSAGEAGKAGKPLLTYSMQTLLDTARTPLQDDWDQTVDLPQACAVHTLQALVRGSGLAAAVLQFASSIAVVSLNLLSSPCWAMRNAALQLFSSLCTRMLGQRSSTDDDGGPSQQGGGMSPGAFFHHYPSLQPFLLGELTAAAGCLQDPSQEARLHLQPSLFPVLTLLAQLQPGVQDSAQVSSDFLPPLLHLSASPIYSVRVVASKALLAVTPPSEYSHILTELTLGLPGPLESCSHNRLHGQLLQIQVLLDRSLRSVRGSDTLADLHVVLSRIEAQPWLATEAQRCPLVRAAYIGVADSLKGFCSEKFLMELSETVTRDLKGAAEGELQIGLASFYQQAISFLCTDPKWACQVWDHFPAANLDLRLALVTWAVEGRRLQHSSVGEVIQRVLQSNLKEALLSHSVDYRSLYLAALEAAMTIEDSAANRLHSAVVEEPFLPECLQLLLEELQQQRGGSEYLSRALGTASLLLSLQPQSSLQGYALQLWCDVLECHRSPDAAEVLRMACGQALCVAGVPLLSKSQRSEAIARRLICTGLHLMQDQSLQVRAIAATFASLLLQRQQQQVRHGEGQLGIVHVLQVNQALPVLLDLLLHQCPGSDTLEVLLSFLPPCDIRSVAQEASAVMAATSVALYEQDEANVFAEPSVMAEQLLPYLLRVVDRCTKCPLLVQNLMAWARENVGLVLDGLAASKELVPADTLSPGWLSLLVHPHLHSFVCGLLARIAVLLRLASRSPDTSQKLCDTSSLQKNSQELCHVLARNGIHLPPALTAAATTSDTQQTV